MGDKTGIEWTDATWNPVTGCDKVSPGCDHCYAETIAHRFAGTTAYPDGFQLTLRPERLEQPLRWSRPRRVFVNSMSDLFHKDVPDEYLARIFAVMALAPQHTFQVLTKRHGRMRSLLSSEDFRASVALTCLQITEEEPGPPHLPESLVLPPEGQSWWPLPNVWLGVSVEDQARADLRIPALLETPAAVRFLSCEPLLGPVDLGYGEPCDHARQSCSDIGCWAALDWVIVGGESGAGSRPMHPGWAQQLRDQCSASGVPFLFKQWGSWAPVAPADARPSDLVVTPAGQTMPWSAVGDLVPEVARRSWVLRRVNKKAAGRELDGVTHDGYPETLEVPA